MIAHVLAAATALSLAQATQPVTAPQTERGEASNDAGQTVRDPSVTTPAQPMNRTVRSQSQPRNANAASTPRTERRTEALAAFRSDFDRIDVNGDGEISEREYTMYVIEGRTLTRLEARRLFRAVSSDGTPIGFSEFTAPRQELGTLATRMMPNE